MTDDGTVRILVADDHILLRGALCDLLDAEPGFEVVAQAGSGTEAIRMAGQYRPDVVLLDIEMPENDPSVTVQRILRQNPGTRIIVLSMSDGKFLVNELLSLGVSGYLHKSVNRETLVSAIRQRQDGGRRTIMVAVAQESLRGFAPGERADEQGLSDREVEVLTCTAQALSNRQIAGRLGITEGTVKRHLRNIFTKLDAVSRIDAVNKAVERSLIAAPVRGGGPPGPAAGSR